MYSLSIIFILALLGGFTLIAIAVAGPGGAGVSVSTAIPGIVIALGGTAALTGLLTNGYFTNRSRTEKTAAASLAAERGIALGQWARPEYIFQSAVVVGAQGSCPLSLINGARWDISPLGRLNMPLCKPAIEAVERAQAARDFGLTISTACKCPLGDQSVSFRLEQTSC